MFKHVEPRKDLKELWDTVGVLTCYYRLERTYSHTFPGKHTCVLILTLVHCPQVGSEAIAMLSLLTLEGKCKRDSGLSHVYPLREARFLDILKNVCCLNASC